MNIKNKYVQHAGLLLKRLRNTWKYSRSANTGSHISLAPELVADYNKHRYYGAQPYVCLAPFNSLFLSINGNVYACNLNRKFILGNISSMPLREIWNNQKVARLREHIANQDLGHGCEKCLFNIQTGRYDAATSSHYDYVGYNNDTRFPLRIDFEISNLCNLGCVMCAPAFSSTIQKEIKGKKLTKISYHPSILEDLKHFIPHLRFMNFSGGEPFMNNLYFEIWELVAQLNPDCQAHIQTNGTVLNQKVKDILSKHRFNIGISIDSLQKETYEKIRLFSDFDKRQAILDYLTDYCHRNNTTLTYSFCLLRQNAYELPDFVTYANQHQAVLYLSPVFEPAEEAIWNQPVAELEALQAYCQSFSFTASNDIQRKNIEHFRQFTQQIGAWIRRQEQYAAYYREHALTDADVIRLIVAKLHSYFDHFREINGTACEDADQCLEFVQHLAAGHDGNKLGLLRCLVLENEERIYNQVKYYWLP